MHFFADFDNQTKLLHVGYSVLGALISLVVLVKFKPTIVPRLVAAIILSFALIYCLAAPTTGDQERLKNIYSVGWFVLGLLFGIGRGEYIIEYLIRKMYGAPDQIAKRFAREEADKANLAGAEDDSKIDNSSASSALPDIQSGEH